MNATRCARIIDHESHRSRQPDRVPASAYASRCTHLNDIQTAVADRIIPYSTPCRASTPKKQGDDTSRQGTRRVHRTAGARHPRRHPPRHPRDGAKEWFASGTGAPQRSTGSQVEDSILAATLDGIPCRPGNVNWKPEELKGPHGCGNHPNPQRLRVSVDTSVPLPVRRIP